MYQILPVPESEASEKTTKIYKRIKESFGLDSVPAPFLLMGRVPALLQDFYMNFKKFVIESGKLTQTEHLAIALAVVVYEQDRTWNEFLRTLAGDKISDQNYADISGIVAACSMYNSFFKFRDLSGSELFSGMSVGLRAHVFTGTSLEEKLTEYINLAISDLNGCRPCMEGHVNRARELGISDEAILEAIQVTATMQMGLKFCRAAM